MNVCTVRVADGIEMTSAAFWTVGNWICFTENSIGVEGRYFLDGEREKHISVSMEIDERMFQRARKRVDEILKSEY